MRRTRRYFKSATQASQVVISRWPSAALAWFEQLPHELLRALLITGFLGGLTTFSAFSGESLWLLQRGQFGLAAGHTLAHLVGALACAALGHRLMTTWLA